MQGSCRVPEPSPLVSSRLKDQMQTRPFFSLASGEEDPEKPEKRLSSVLLERRVSQRTPAISPARPAWGDRLQQMGT